nr:hypothetical protein GZ11A10_43 [uncultured archaeon GZfos11A10]
MDGGLCCDLCRVGRRGAQVHALSWARERVMPACVTACRDGGMLYRVERNKKVRKR